jgi:hypothetical protein
MGSPSLDVSAIELLRTAVSSRHSNSVMRKPRQRCACAAGISRCICDGLCCRCALAAVGAPAQRPPVTQGAVVADDDDHF